MINGNFWVVSFFSTHLIEKCLLTTGIFGFDEANTLSHLSKSLNVVIVGRGSRSSHFWRTSLIIGVCRASCSIGSRSSWGSCTLVAVHVVGVRWGVRWRCSRGSNVSGSAGSWGDVHLNFSRFRQSKNVIDEYKKINPMQTTKINNIIRFIR
jgi:lysylphosphatidylglycerol synthetase-like protein (DUF2156 family)